jgi:hypothetical protein
VARSVQVQLCLFGVIADFLIEDPKLWLDCCFSNSLIEDFICRVLMTCDLGVLTEEVPYLIVMRASQVIDVSLTPGDKTSGFLTPVVGIEGGIQIDYDRKKQVLFWVEGKEDDDENVSNILNTFIVRPDSQFDVQSTVHHDIFL